MRALTVWQPWASLLACGAKTYVTCSWPTDYRGPIAIYAGAKKPQWFLGTIHPEKQSAMLEVLYPLFVSWDNIPRGCVIATAELVECWHIVQHPGRDADEAGGIPNPIGAEFIVPKGYRDKRCHPRQGDYIVPAESELLFGDWTPGRYALEFRNVIALSKPIPAKGGQRFWNWEEKKEEMPV